MLRDVAYRLRCLLRRRAVDRELDRELQFHFEHQVEKLAAGGLPRAEALRQARLAFGGMGQVKDECRDARGLAALDTALQDLRHALRLWRRNPGFALAAVAAIGLGIGANATVFTLANSVLFKSLAYEGSGHIVYVIGTRPDCELPCDTGRSYPDYIAFREHAKSFQALVAYAFGQVNVSDGTGLPERYKTMRVSANAFSALGQKPLAGRDFIAADERPGAPPVAILSYGLWETRYGKDPSVVGKSIRIDGVPTVVAGIMPPSMQFRVSVDLWMPLIPDGDWRKREHRALMILGRLRGGATTASAAAELDALSRRLASAYPEADKDIGIRVLEGKQYFQARIRPVFEGLWIVVGLVLLVACANVANLLLARAVVRSREISIRAALGAGRGRVIRQLLVESVALSVAGGLLGWLLGLWGVRAFDAAIAGTGKPPWLDFTMDYRVFAYLSAISIAAGILFGLVPALRLSRIDVHAALKDGGYGASGGISGRYLAGLLVTGEMALTVVLLVGAVVTLRTMLNLYRSEIGVNPSHVLTMIIDLRSKQYAAASQWTAFYEQLQARLEALPGVQAVAMASSLPGHGGIRFRYQLEGAAPAEKGAEPEVRGLVVGAGYFRSLGAPPFLGREFTSADGRAAPVAMVNRSFAERFWPGGNPVGRRLRLLAESGVPRGWLTVVGVVPDIWQNEAMRREFQPLIYLPYREQPLASMAVVARTAPPPETLGPAFRRQVQALDQDLPVFALRSLEEDLKLHDWPVRVFGAMLALFAGIAMLLASIGLYAVVAHSVNQRRREIGVRVAMGATRSKIVTLVFAHGLSQLAAGLLLGLAAAFGLTRLLRTVLAGELQPDWLTFVTVALTLLAAGVLACAIPALRATRVDPLAALRFE